MPWGRGAVFEARCWWGLEPCSTTAKSYDDDEEEDKDEDEDEDEDYDEDGDDDEEEE